MLLAYCHLLLFIATLVSHFHISSPVSGSTAGTNPGVRQTARYDPDNDSLGPPYGLRVIGNSNHDDTLMTSNPHDNSNEDANPPPQIASDQPVVDVYQPATNDLMPAEDLYQSADSI